MRLSTGSSRCIPSSGSPRLSIRLVEFRMSANSSVRFLRSPPLVLSERSNWLGVGSARPVLLASATPQWPQNLLEGPLIVWQASHLRPNGAPQLSQKPFSGLFKLPHCSHCMDNPSQTGRLGLTFPVVQFHQRSHRGFDLAQASVESRRARESRVSFSFLDMAVENASKIATTRPSSHEVTPLPRQYEAVL